MDREEYRNLDARSRRQRTTKKCKADYETHKAMPVALTERQRLAAMRQGKSVPRLKVPTGGWPQQQVIQRQTEKTRAAAKQKPSGMKKEVLLPSKRGLEAYYRFQVTSWLQVSPDVQYLIDPGLTSDNDDTLVLGLRALIHY